MKKIGFVGLGRMGRGMASQLIQHTGSLWVYDQSSEAMQALTRQGATACQSLTEIGATCELIFLCLPYAPEVRSVLFGSDGIAAAKARELTIIDTTTLDRSDALQLGQQAAEQGIDYWDCPISGMPFRADNGTLTVMFGGSEQAFNSYLPLLQSFGEVVTHCGQRGAGQAMKALNNIIYNINITALCEVLPLATAVGLDPQQVASVVTSASSRSFASEYFVPRMLERRFDTDFSLNDAYKDIVNVQKMGIETRASLPLVNAMIASYQAAIAAGFGDQPKSAMLKVYEHALGVEYRAPDEP